ncbi:hypothetical protein GPK42_01395 [Collinsella aerofaciens]|uniref:hypothetical protein n=1 Tax=Collinsella aerofaciens TaxID=74426 RepID=UPI001C00EAE6|nr:hypothetical protein [Collinsella aerofaciens]MBT9759478.1 hypothetical protein [Collinsella aerofaciens]
MIELPKDAEGRDIPLDTKVLYDYDGSKQNVEVFIFSRKDAGWSVETDFAIYDAEELYLTPPDSWEKLLEDLGAAGDARYQEACAYFHRDKDEDGCTSCPGGEDGCGRIAMRDIASRIRRLRGEN